MRPFCLGAAIWLSCACGDNASELANYYPLLPPPTGGAQQAFAGQVTDASQLVAGPAQSGMIGDFFIKNDKATFIVQSPARVLGVIPQGGNLVDATLNDGSTVDHFGELGLMYVLGRTCEPDHVDIVRDGAGGGTTEAWTNTRGFERADIGQIATLGTPHPTDFVVYQGPGVAYGVIPRHDVPTTHTQVLI